MDRPVRVALLNDFDIVVHGLAAMLSPFESLDVVDVSVGEIDVSVPVDVALYDTYGRHSLPWRQTAELVAEPLAAHVALFSFVVAPEVVDEAVAAGVHGYLWKGLPPAELADALVRIADGELVISPSTRVSQPQNGKAARWPFEELGVSARESEVLALLVDGMSNRAIASALYIGQETVKSHVRELYRKLGVHNRTEATARALRDDSFARRSPRQAVSHAVPEPTG